MKKIQLLAIKEAKDNWLLFSGNIAGKHKQIFFYCEIKKPIGLQKYSSNDTSSMVQQLKMQLNRLRNFLEIFYWFSL